MVINEIMYDPAGTDGTRHWIEIYNHTSSSIDLTGWRLREAGSNHSLTFTQGGSVIPCNGFAIIAENASQFLTEYSTHTAVTGGIVIDSSFSLNNTGESLAILDDDLVAISSLTYLGDGSWPSATSQSIERRDHAGADNSGANWALGIASGTPNVQNVAATGAAVSCSSTESNCNNAVDDDGDGQADCADTDCASNVICAPGASTTTVRALAVDDAFNPFSPSDRDSNFRSGRILFNVYSGNFIKTIRVANVRGETVRVLINNDAGPSSTFYTGIADGFVLWDGRDDNGDVVPMGIYVVFLEAVDPTTGDRVTGRDTIAVGRPF